MKGRNRKKKTSPKYKDYFRLPINENEYIPLKGKKGIFSFILLILLIFIILVFYIIDILNSHIDDDKNIIIYKNIVQDIKELRGNKTKKNLNTDDFIFWENNTKVNLTKIEEEISSYENMTPTFSYKDLLYKRRRPKVSLIIPVYNQEKYIKKIYVTIENQNLKSLEIIFVDDCSSDNSSNVIKELMEIDKRIVYIKNKENKGAFYSRNIGVLNSKGEYVFCADVDDYLLNDILYKSYITSITYNLDILQFYAMAGDFKKNIWWKVLKYKSGIMRDNKVKEIFFKGTTRNTWDKFVKRKIFIKSIEFMDKKFRDHKFVVYNDDVSILGLLKTAKSYGFLEEIGYIYNWAVPNSTTHIYEDMKYTNDIFKTCFTIMEYFYEQTEDNQYEKMQGFSFFKKKINPYYNKNIEYLTDGFDYIIKVLDLYLNSSFYNEDQKKLLKEFKDKIISAKNKKNGFK
jgi:glycosyltransferase involved in cell wall biosynthesis